MPTAIVIQSQGDDSLEVAFILLAPPTMTKAAATKVAKMVMDQIDDEMTEEGEERDDPADELYRRTVNELTEQYGFTLLEEEFIGP